MSLLSGCPEGGEGGFVAGTDGAEESVGERLFLETRFAQAFKAFLDGGGRVNESLPAGDPVLDNTKTTGQPLPGAFAGLTMNCRTCHLVDEHVIAPSGGMRTYTDFARRSPVPDRPDGNLTAVRNAPSLVNASLHRPGGKLFHFDAEFATLEDLVDGTFTGRNFGWLPGERDKAMAHITNVVRGDNGTGQLAQGFEFLSQELAGFKIFLAEPRALPPTAAELAQGQIGNCVACHPAPNFTDFKVHNTGITQQEYDNIHGAGQFVLLAIPFRTCTMVSWTPWTPSSASISRQQRKPNRERYATVQKPFWVSPSPRLIFSHS